MGLLPAPSPVYRTPGRTEVRLIYFDRALQLHWYLPQAHQVAAQTLVEHGGADSAQAREVGGIAGSQI